MMRISLGQPRSAQDPPHTKQSLQEHAADYVSAPTHPRGPQINALEQCPAHKCNRISAGAGNQDGPIIWAHTPWAVQPSCGHARPGPLS